MNTYIHFRSVCLLILLLLPIGVANPVPQQSPPSWFWGCWTVTKLLPVTDSSGLSPRQEDAILGKRLVFGSTCARSGHAVVKSPTYSTKIVSERDFFKLGYFPLDQIGIHAKQITNVEITLPNNMSNLNFPGNHVYLREKDIVIEVEGDYFVAERAKPGDPTCKCEKTKTE